MAHDVFISYARTDRGYAERLVEALLAEGVNVWWDQELRPGEEWSKQIEQALLQTSAVVSLLSPTSLKSRAVMRESGFADAIGLRVVPVLVGGAKYSDLPLSLRSIQAFVWDDKIGDAGARRIALEIAASIKNRPAPTAPPPQVQAPQAPQSARKSWFRFDRQKAAPGDVAAPHGAAPAAPGQAPAAPDTAAKAADALEALRRLSKAAAETAREISKPAPPEESAGPPKSIFVVHGRDKEMLNEVTTTLESWGVEPVVLQRQRTADKDLFAKFRRVAKQARHAVVLVSGDDVGTLHTEFQQSAGHSLSLMFRARQNVILELGFFYGRLDEESVFAFLKPPPACNLVLSRFERPSDIAGNIIEDFDDTWKEVLKGRLLDAGFVLKA